MKHQLFDDIKNELKIRMDVLATAKRPWTDDPPYIYQDTIQILQDDKTILDYERIIKRLVNMASYYNFLGSDKYEEIIKQGYLGVFPQVDDSVIFYRERQRYVGFVNAVKTTVDKTKFGKNKEYMSVYITYVREDCNSYTENVINRTQKDIINTRLARNMTFGRPFYECINDFLKYRNIQEEEIKRRNKRKIMTVGEYEDMMKLLNSLAENICDINRKIPYSHHSMGPG